MTFTLGEISRPQTFAHHLQDRPDTQPRFADEAYKHIPSFDNFTISSRSVLHKPDV